MRIFLDANILFSAAKSEGAVSRLLELLRRAGHECVADGFVVEEARRNLALKAPGRGNVFEALLGRISLAPAQAPGDDLGAIALADKDRPVLAAAIRLRCEALLTGDRTHFGALYGKRFHGVAVHSPRSLAEALLG
ncbi:MAG: PIN domain-containing protein [Betaproteobacteria bacterium]